MTMFSGGRRGEPVCHGNKELDQHGVAAATPAKRQYYHDHPMPALLPQKKSPWRYIGTDTGSLDTQACSGSS